MVKPNEQCDLCADPSGKPQELFIHARCHLSAPLQVSMEGDVLVVRCYLPDCYREVGRFKVAEQLDVKAEPMEARRCRECGKAK